MEQLTYEEVLDDIRRRTAGRKAYLLADEARVCRSSLSLVLAGKKIASTWFMERLGYEIRYVRKVQK